MCIRDRYQRRVRGVLLGLHGLLLSGNPGEMRSRSRSRDRQRGRSRSRDRVPDGFRGRGSYNDRGGGGDAVPRDESERASYYEKRRKERERATMAGGLWGASASRSPSPKRRSASPKKPYNPNVDEFGREVEKPDKSEERVDFDGSASPARPAKSRSPERRKRSASRKRSVSRSSSEERPKKKKKKEKKKRKKKKSKKKKRKKKSSSSSSSSSSSDSEPEPEPDAVVAQLAEAEVQDFQKHLDMTRPDEDSEPEAGPMPLPKVDVGSYGGALLPGEGEAIASYVQEGKRIPRRGEVGMTSDQISAYEDLGFIMSGSRHRRMETVRIRKESQVYSAEEKRALALFNYEEKAKRENQILADFKSLLETKTKEAGIPAGAAPPPPIEE
eukprot:TRINITY_DN2875_c0_g6_i1.p1 TRINITY_DN2875_c0_g6~~TRINITY_DN2875_c0_g6_i1.p1  ORF type:complete len:385 (+),score=98.08 TRINITY_DN2875_c0_g6_i1:96-1250(+)